MLNWPATCSVSQSRTNNRTNLRSIFTHSDWWKLHALFYMMRHPQAAYRTRDVRAHLAKLGLHIGSLNFRRFRKWHSIRRDMRAGRPRTRSRES